LTDGTYISTPKIPISRVYCGGPWSINNWYIYLFHDILVFNYHLVCFIANWYIFWLFDIFCSRFGMLKEKNPATLNSIGY
jgi:hypothetical protein